MLKRLVVAVSVLLLVGANTLSAAMLQFETHMTGAFGFENPVPISLAGFHPSWGTLYWVTLETELRYSGAISATNPYPDYPFPATADVILVWFLGGGLVAGDERFQVTWDVIPPGGSQTVQFAGVATRPFFGPIGEGLVPYFVTPRTVDTVLWVDHGGMVGGDLFQEMTGQTDDILIRVIYEYQPSTVPEPTSLLLLGIGAAGLIVKQRRARN